MSKTKVTANLTPYYYFVNLLQLKSTDNLC